MVPCVPGIGLHPGVLGLGYGKKLLSINYNTLEIDKCSKTDISLTPEENKEE